MPKSSRQQKKLNRSCSGCLLSLGLLTLIIPGIGRWVQNTVGQWHATDIHHAEQAPEKPVISLPYGLGSVNLELLISIGEGLYGLISFVVTIHEFIELMNKLLSKSQDDGTKELKTAALNAINDVGKEFENCLSSNPHITAYVEYLREQEVHGYGYSPLRPLSKPHHEGKTQLAMCAQTAAGKLFQWNGDHGAKVYSTQLSIKVSEFLSRLRDKRTRDEDPEQLMLLFQDLKNFIAYEADLTLP